MNEEITKMFDVFYANIKFGLVPLSGEMQDHLRELEDKVVRFEYDMDESDQEHHWGEGFDSGFSEGYEKGKEEGFDEGYAEHETEMKEWYEEKHR
jgi:flagellar biosynthesis/type III secretory pathway protein FliH